MKIPTFERRNEIIKALLEHGYVEASVLAQTFRVSMETIRKDLTQLECEGVVVKEYGGARLQTSGIEQNLQVRMKHSEKKKQIAHTALTLLDDAKIIFMDAGSTVHELAKCMNTLPSLDIVTNSLLVWDSMDALHHNIFLTGGRKREKNVALTGNWCVNAIKSVHADICFLGTSGILDQKGPTTHSYQVLEAKQAMIAQSDRVYVLADSDKFKESGFHTLCTWKDIDGIITDNFISSKTYEHYHKIVPLFVGKENEDEKNSKD